MMLEPTKVKKNLGRKTRKCGAQHQLEQRNGIRLQCYLYERRKKEIVVTRVDDVTGMIGRLQRLVW